MERNLRISDSDSDSGIDNSLRSLEHSSDDTIEASNKHTSATTKKETNKVHKTQHAPRNRKRKRVGHGKGKKKVKRERNPHISDSDSDNTMQSKSVIYGFPGLEQEDVPNEEYTEKSGKNILNRLQHPSVLSIAVTVEDKVGESGQRDENHKKMIGSGECISQPIIPKHPHEIIDSSPPLAIEHLQYTIFPSLWVPHDFVHMTSEVHLTNPLNERGDNVLHIAVDLSRVINIQYLLQQDGIDALIVKGNLKGVSPLYKAHQLNMSDLFECLLEEFIRSYGWSVGKKYVSGIAAAECYTAKSKCEQPLSDCATFNLQCEEIKRQFDCKGGIQTVVYVSYSEGTVFSEPDHEFSHNILNSCGRPLKGNGVLAFFPVLKSNHKPCSDIDFKNAVLCTSTQFAPYLLYKREFNEDPGCCGPHKVEQRIALPGECSPVPPYLGRRSEILRQGSSSSRHSNCQRRHAEPPKAASDLLRQPKYYHQTPIQSHSTIRQDFSKKQHYVEPDGAKIKQEDQIMRIHIHHFSLAADCLHAQDYVRMLHSLSYCSICNSATSKVRLDHKTQIAYLFGCGLAHTKLLKQREAFKHFKTCEAIAVEDNHKGDVALCNQYLGDIQLAKQLFISAAEHYSKAVEYYFPESVAQSFKMIAPSLSGLYAKLASALRNASKVVDAVQAYKNAIAMAESKKDKLSAHTSLGNLYQSVGENTSALTEYEHSIKLSEELEDYVSLGWAHGNMGNGYLGLYQRDKALHHLEKSLELALSYEPTPQAIGRAYNNLGTAHQALGEYDKAQENYDLALGQGIYGNDIPGQARVYGNIGNLLMVRQDYERAIPHYTEVLRLSKDRSTVSTAYHNRGCAYYELAESKKAKITTKSAYYLHVCDIPDSGTGHQPPIVSNSIVKLYRQGNRDLEEVVKLHEETLNSIKGSEKGLTLSVSLFESNSRTFHRLQDCLVSTGEWIKALIVAEQSRARTLGELLLKKKGWQLEDSLSAPLTLDRIISVVKSQSSPVLYLSYTGARLLGWVLLPDSESVKMGMFEIPMKDDQFEGKSFDYHLRYSLNELLVEKSFEMYKSFDYSSKLNDPVIILYNLIGKPLRSLLNRLNTSESESRVQSIIVIPDSYTNLLPFTCLLAVDPEGDVPSVRFLGDQYSFQIMPSLLTMGVLDQLPPTIVKIPADSQDMCVVGNPTIPPFNYNGEPWNLGKLPYATKEAQWVAHILRTTPILHEQATKNAVLMRILNSKVIHIATHGSAAAGFLAFAGMVSSRNKQAIDSSGVLIYPKDIEKQSISPALVVLSSCDSGRGEVKADGIQGMARAFILAGAQAVLTTLWRVPDESASVFMQFFYQYLVDGFCGSEALQKAILSLRCFSKYSQYIHWSGYQLTGREIQFIGKPKILETQLGPGSVFPRLDDMRKLESALINDPHIPTDVQILRGSPGMKPSEPVIDFIHSFHHHFKGGIFWVNGRTKELIEASTSYIEKVTGSLLSEITASDVQQVLVVLDYFEHLPVADPWIKFLKNPNIHIIVISKHCSPPELLQKEVDCHLLRGCSIINVQPLSMVHTIQRFVHSIQEQYHLAPGNEEQDLFERLADFISGSPFILDTASALLLSHMKHGTTPRESLQEFSESISLCQLPKNSGAKEESPIVAKVREISRNVAKNIPSLTSTSDEDDPWNTDVHYDSWQSISNIIAGSKLSQEERLLLYSLSVFSCCPIPMSVVTEISTLIAKASHKAHLSGNLYSKLFELKFLRIYPTPVVLHPSLCSQQGNLEPELVYAPQYLASGLWKHVLSPMDKAIALSTVFKALSAMSTQGTNSPLQFFFLGLCSLLLEVFELNYEQMGKQCYQEVYKLFLLYRVNSLQVM